MFDSEYWRGATHHVGATQTSPFYFNGALFQTVIIDWKVKGNDPKLCMLPGWEFTPAVVLMDSMHREIYRRVPIGYYLYYLVSFPQATRTASPSLERVWRSGHLAGGQAVLHCKGEFVHNFLAACGA